MRDLLSEAIFTVTIVRTLTTIYLFARCREGERSRIILAIISLFTIFHYASRYLTAIHGQLPMQVVSTPMLLIALFMITSYIMYPIEVVSPGWINFKRIILLYSPVGVLYGIWQITLWCGVEYTQYNSLQEMLPYISNIDVWFRFILCFLILCPVLFIFLVPYTKKYSNTTYRWKWIYATIFSINTISFLVVLWERTLTTSVQYYYIGTGCFLAIAYAELSTRIIRYPMSETFSPEMSSKVFEEVLCQSEPCMPANTDDKTENTNSVLFNRLDEYMKRNAAWRDPDLTLNKLSSIMHTNRTTLSLAIQTSEYGNYTAYINKLRFDDFVYCVTNNSLVNYQDAFYDAGFRSRTTALRNFRQITGMTPTEYFTGNNIKTDR